MIKYRVGHKSNSIEEDGFNIVVMGSSKVGKTTLIKRLLRLNDGKPDNILENIYEYRFGAENILRTKGSQEPPLLSRAISTGNAFLLLFSVYDCDSFEYANQLRDLIVGSKGESTPIICVGLTDEQNKPRKREISFEFADLVISCDWENKYQEVSLTTFSGLTELYEEALCQQITYYKNLEEENLKSGSLRNEKLSFIKRCYSVIRCAENVRNNSKTEKAVKSDSMIKK